MANQAFKLTPEISHTILAFIRQGAFPHMAAEAAGIPKAHFEAWVKRGEKKKAREPFRSFARGVVQAIAQARIMAELAVCKDDPKFWLKFGPGKESPGNPGWSREVKPILPTTATQINILASPEWGGLWYKILSALANFPEARAALAAAIRDQDPPPLQHQSAPALPPPAEPRNPLPI